MFPGDVILGDADGVMVIPAHLADEIANEAFDPATDQQTLIDFAAWRKAHGR